MKYTYDQETPGAWASFIEAMHSGEEIEIDDEIYYYFLEVLPPVFMNRTLPFPDPKHPMRYDFGLAEGAEKIVAFWRTGSQETGFRYYCRQTPFMNPAA